MTVSEDTQDLKQLADVDPDQILDGLNESITRRMPSYRDLYRRWERLNWKVSDLDFEQDRADWADLDDLHKDRLLWTLAAFYVAEQRVAATLTPFVAAAPHREQRIFLTTQLVDEQRHALFFDRWFEEVAGVGSSRDLSARLAFSRKWVGPGFAPLFDEYLESVTSRLRDDPSDVAQFAKAVAMYHIVIEGVLALTGQKFILAWARNNGILPGFRAGFTAVARDESRHVSFGARVIRDLLNDDPTLLAPIQEGLSETLRLGTALYQPPNGDVTFTSAFGYSLGDLFAYGGTQLEKKMRAIGMPSPHVDVWVPPMDAEWPPPGGGLIPNDWGQRAMASTMRAIRKAVPRFAPGVSIMMLYLGFRPEKAAGIDAVWEFHLKGRGGGIYTVTVRDGSCRIDIGPGDRTPDVVYEMDAIVWAELTAGYATGDEAVLLGKLRITGDPILGRIFNEVFSPPGEPLVHAASREIPTRANESRSFRLRAPSVRGLVSRAISCVRAA
ncbi:MAG TPA: ribonucleotide-diphosphate reductase subunit beta [Actinomycetota bacterium]|nr:ribonucleotide-diphosphate reductase subunit beta [Actinomycetota bacterium]